MKDFRPPTQGLGKSLGAERVEHELLNVDIVVRVSASIEDIHHGCGQQTSRFAAEPAIKRPVGLDSRRAGRRQGNPQQRVGPESRLGFGPVEFDQPTVQGGLRLDRAEFQSLHRLGDLAVHKVHGFSDALAPIALRVAIAQFERFA